MAKYQYPEDVAQQLKLLGNLTKMLNSTDPNEQAELVETMKDICTPISSRRDMQADLQLLALTYLSYCQNQVGNFVPQFFETPRQLQDAEAVLKLLGESPRVSSTKYTREQLDYARVLVKDKLIEYMKSLVAKDVEDTP